MTQLDILKCAYGWTLEMWSNEYDRLQQDPTNTVTKARLDKASKDFEEIRSLLLVEEQKEAEERPMNRLTRWNGKKWVLPQGKTSDGESYFRIIAERLAAYENTGLEPEEIMLIKEAQK